MSGLQISGLSRHDNKSLQWVVALLGAGSIIATGLLVGNGVAGILGAIALLITFGTLTVPYGVAVGTVGVVAAVGGARPGPMAWIALTTLLLLLLVSERRERNSLGKSKILLFLLGGLGITSVIALIIWNRPWIASLTLLVIGGLIAYGLHRYEQVRIQVARRD